MARRRIVRSAEGAEVWPWRVKASGADTQGRFDFMVGDVGYLTGPPLHSHRTQDDSFYVLEGVLTLQTDEETVELHPGDFVTIPPGVAHTFDNIHADQPRVRVINLMTPGGYDEALLEFNGLGDEILDLERAAEVGRRHGVDILGPPLRVKLGLGD